MDLKEMAYNTDQGYYLLNDSVETEVHNSGLMDDDPDVEALKVLDFPTPSKQENTQFMLPFKKKRFATSTDYNKPTKSKNDESHSRSNKEVLDVLKLILEKQTSIETRLAQLENAVHEISKDKYDQMAHTKLTRECKVLLKKVHNSVCRMTGEVDDEVQIEIAASFPLSSIDAAMDLEEKLTAQEFSVSMTTYLHKLRGASGEMEGVFKKIMTDELV